MNYLDKIEEELRQILDSDESESENGLILLSSSFGTKYSSPTRTVWPQLRRASHLMPDKARTIRKVRGRNKGYRLYQKAMAVIFVMLFGILVWLALLAI